jgi:hypothetical protein
LADRLLVLSAANAFRTGQPINVDFARAACEHPASVALLGAGTHGTPNDNEPNQGRT